MSDLFIVKHKVKEISGDMNVSSDYPDALNEKVRKIILESIERAKANGRRTLMAKDL